MSRRMGQDKGLLILNKDPMIFHILKKLEGNVDEVVLVLRDDNQLKNYKNIIVDSLQLSFDLKFVTDIIKNQGPLAGIYTGLNYIESDYGLILPCDSPYITSSFIENLFQFLENSKENFDAIVSISHGDKEPFNNIQPLHSIYSKKIKEKIPGLLSEGKRDVKSLIGELNVYFIDFEQLDPSKKSFINLNRPEDLN